MRGTNLSEVTVTFGGQPMTSITGQSENIVSGSVPPGTVGVVPVVIANAAGCQVTLSFSYQYPGARRCAAVAPSPPALRMLPG